MKNSVFARNIAKHIPSYPSIEDTPDFSYQISRKKEFYDIKLPSEEDTPKVPGTPLFSQELQARFFSPNTNFSSGLLYHGVGTGKTCLSSLIIENFKSMLVDGKKRKPALVLVANDVLADAYRKEVARKCTKEGIYLPKLTEAELRKLQEGEDVEMSDITQEKRLRSAIAESYEIVTYEKFFLESETVGYVGTGEGQQKIWKMVKKLSRNPEFIRAKFNNRVIIVDEAHNFRVQPKKSGKKRAFPSQEKGVSIELYNEMHRFLHIIENCRIILLTGTPIWDKVYEIAGIMNLILPENEQLPIRDKFLKEFFDKDGKLIPEKARYLKDRFRGRISYLRQMTTTAQREEIGVKSPWLKNITVYPSAMSQFQYESSQKLKNEDIKVNKGFPWETSEKGKGLRLKARDGANFIFPSIKNLGNGKYQIEKALENDKVFQKTSKQPQPSRPIDNLRDGKIFRYRTPLIGRVIKENLSEFSSKFAAIIDLIQNNPNELVFIYNEFVETPGGAINLALVLQLFGFVWAKKVSDIGKPRNEKRFAVITSKKSTIHDKNQIRNFIDSFNKDDNKYGERCQIIIGSKKIGAGVTLKNIRQVHVMMPHWNISSVDQAEGRAFRVGSHDALPEEERYIKIYRHVAVQEFDEEEHQQEYNKGLGFPRDAGFTKEETMDIYVYKAAESKDSYNAQIYRLLKEVSWDCPLSYERNVLKGDQENTRPCDYMECNYRCDNFPERNISKGDKVWKYKIPQDEILRDTYNLFYSGEDIMEMTNRIKELFGIYFSLRLDLVADLLNIKDEEETDLLLRALDIIINIRLLIKNRYGFGSYLKEQGNVYFLDNNVSTFANYPENTYINMPLITERSSLEEIVEIQQFDEDKNLVQEFCVEPKKKANVLELMNYRTLIVLLESIKELEAGKENNKLTKRETEAINVIMKKMGKNLVTMPDGKTIHNMYNSEYTGVGYNVAVQEIKPTGLIRVFDSKTLEWRYASPDEEENFVIKLKQSEKKKREDVWEGNPYGVYGFRDKSNNFKIRVKPEAGRETKGSVCLEVSWTVNKLHNLFHKLGALPPPMEEFKDLSKKELIDNIKAQPSLAIFKNDIESRTLEELQGIRTLYSMSKKQMCGFLEEWFEEQGFYYSE